MWFFNAPDIKNEAFYIEFIEKTINAQLADHLNDPELVKSYEVHAHSWKYKQSKCCFSYGQCFIENTTIAKQIDSKFNNAEKQGVLKWTNEMIFHQRMPKSMCKVYDVNVRLKSN